MMKIDSAMTAKRPLRFFAQGWGELSEPLGMLQLPAMRKIESFGLPVSDLLKRCETLDDMLAHYAAIEQARAEYRRRERRAAARQGGQR